MNALQPQEDRTPALPRQGQWSAKPAPVRWTRRALPVSFGMVQALYYGVGFVTILLGSQMPRWSTDLYFLAMLGFVALWLVQVAWEGATRFKRAKDQALSDRTPGLVEHPLEIVIINEDALVGNDRGIAWFEDDRLHYSGAATSFVLAATDIVPRKWLTTRNPYANLPNDAIRLDLEGQAACVRLLPLHGHRRRFRAALQRFLYARVPNDNPGPRQWPPLEPYGTSSEGTRSV